MITVRAPAKINWFLHVLGRRMDGFHEIVSLIQRVDLCDALYIEPSGALEIITDADIPLELNLVYRAALLLKEECGIKTGARITLRKEIPVSAGLGGGSSDAAATLRGLNELWGLKLDASGLMDMGARIGSDVPFFLSSPAAVVRGRGEIIEPVGLKRACTVLLVKPREGASAGWAYGSLGMRPGDKVLTKKYDNIKLFCQALEMGDFSALSYLQRNDLEPYVIKGFPAVGEIKRFLREHGALLAAMSGSGTCVFGVFPEQAGAQSAAGKCRETWWCRVASTLA